MALPHFSTIIDRLPALINWVGIVAALIPLNKCFVFAINVNIRSVALPAHRNVVMKVLTGAGITNLANLAVIKMLKAVVFVVVVFMASLIRVAVGQNFCAQVTLLVVAAFANVIVVLLFLLKKPNRVLVSCEGVGLLNL